jgi:hypothetical protein
MSFYQKNSHLGGGYAELLASGGCVGGYGKNIV